MFSPLQKGFIACFGSDWHFDCPRYVSIAERLEEIGAFEITSFDEYTLYLNPCSIEKRRGNHLSFTRWELKQFARLVGCQKIRWCRPDWRLNKACPDFAGQDWRSWPRASCIV